MKVTVGYYEHRTMEVEVNEDIVKDYLDSEAFSPYALLSELDKILGNLAKICTIYLDNEVIYEN